MVTGDVGSGDLEKFNEFGRVTHED